MKRFTIIILAMALLFLPLAGCKSGTSTPTPTPGCENSFTTLHKGTFDVIMTASTYGLYALAAWKPDIYKQAHRAAVDIIAMLERPESVTLQQLTQVDGVSLLGVLELLGYFGANQFLDKCDRAYLVAYLKMI